MVEKVMCLHRTEANQRKIKFEAQYDNLLQKGLDSIISDEQRIMQVLLGLQSNAIKFTRSGHVLIKIKIENEFLKIRIEDTGIGINKQD